MISDYYKRIWAEEKLDLNYEVRRLIKAKGIDLKFVVEYIPYESKIEILSTGVVEGWYGNEIVQRRILKDHYEDVTRKTNEILSQEKQRL